MRKILFVLMVLSLLVLSGCAVFKTCPAIAKVCPDGTGVGQHGPNCEFDKCPAPAGATYCEDSRPEICTMDYNPVCGYLANPQQCEEFWVNNQPCTKTYSNGCSACSDTAVIYWLEGEC
jgi:hypothetical protein